MMETIKIEVRCFQLKPETLNEICSYCDFRGWYWKYESNSTGSMYLYIRMDEKEFHVVQNNYILHICDKHMIVLTREEFNSLDPKERVNVN